MPTGALPLFEHIVHEDEEDKIPVSYHTYQTVFEDHNHEERTVIHPRSF